MARDYVDSHFSRLPAGPTLRRAVLGEARVKRAVPVRRGPHGLNATDARGSKVLLVADCEHLLYKHLFLMISGNQVGEFTGWI